MKMLITIASLFLLLLFGAPASAQSPPYVYPLTLGMSPSQVLTENPQRGMIVFHNPGATATIAFCPAGPARQNGAPFTCSVNGPGSINLLPYQSYTICCGGLNGPVNLTSGWNGVASTGAAPGTILELQ
jgi:hypothetical protein